MGLLEFVQGIKDSHEEVVEKEDVLDEAWSADDEGDMKLQKIIRKKLQGDDDPDEPFGYRKGTSGTILSHALRMKFSKDDDARKQKSPEHIQKMLAARKDKMKSYKDNLYGEHDKCLILNP